MLSIHTVARLLMVCYKCDLPLGYFRRRKKNFIIDIISWLWNINSLFTDCYSYAAVLQVSI